MSASNRSFKEPSIEILDAQNEILVSCGVLIKDYAEKIEVQFASQKRLLSEPYMLAVSDIAKNQPNNLQVHAYKTAYKEFQDADSYVLQKFTQLQKAANTLLKANSQKEIKPGFTKEIKSLIPEYVEVIKFKKFIAASVNEIKQNNFDLVTLKKIRDQIRSDFPEKKSDQMAEILFAFFNAVSLLDNLELQRRKLPLIYETAESAKKEFFTQLEQHVEMLKQSLDSTESNAIQIKIKELSNAMIIVKSDAVIKLDAKAKELSDALVLVHNNQFRASHLAIKSKMEKFQESFQSLKQEFSVANDKKEWLVQQRISTFLLDIAERKNTIRSYLSTLFSQYGSDRSKWPILELEGLMITIANLKKVIDEAVVTLTTDLKKIEEAELKLANEKLKKVKQEFEVLKQDKENLDKHVNDGINELVHKERKEVESQLTIYVSLITQAIGLKRDETAKLISEYLIPAEVSKPFATDTGLPFKTELPKQIKERGEAIKGLSMELGKRTNNVTGMLERFYNGLQRIITTVGSNMNNFTTKGLTIWQDEFLAAETLKSIKSEYKKLETKIIKGIDDGIDAFANNELNIGAKATQIQENVIKASEKEYQQKKDVIVDIQESINAVEKELTALSTPAPLPSNFEIDKLKEIGEESIATALKTAKREIEESEKDVKALRARLEKINEKTTRERKILEALSDSYNKVFTQEKLHPSDQFFKNAFQVTLQSYLSANELQVMSVDESNIDEANKQLDVFVKTQQEFLQKNKSNIESIRAHAFTASAESSLRSLGKNRFKILDDLYSGISGKDAEEVTNNAQKLISILPLEKISELNDESKVFLIAHKCNLTRLLLTKGTYDKKDDKLFFLENTLNNVLKATVTAEEKIILLKQAFMHHGKLFSEASDINRDFMKTVAYVFNWTKMITEIESIDANLEKSTFTGITGIITTGVTSLFRPATTTKDDEEGKRISIEKKRNSLEEISSSHGAADEKLKKESVSESVEVKESERLPVETNAPKSRWPGISIPSMSMWKKAPDNTNIIKEGVNALGIIKLLYDANRSDDLIKDKTEMKGYFDKVAKLLSSEATEVEKIRKIEDVITLIGPENFDLIKSMKTLKDFDSKKTKVKFTQ